MCGWDGVGVCYLLSFSLPSHRPGSAEGQHLGSGAPAPVVPSPRELLLVVRAVPAAPATQLVKRHIPACGPACPRAFHASEQGTGHCWKGSTGAALFQLQYDKSCFPALCPSAFSSEGDVPAAGRVHGSTWCSHSACPLQQLPSARSSREQQLCSRAASLWREVLGSQSEPWGRDTLTLLRALPVPCSLWAKLVGAEGFKPRLQFKDNDLSK